MAKKFYTDEYVKKELARAWEMMTADQDWIDYGNLIKGLSIMALNCSAAMRTSVQAAVNEASMRQILKGARPE